MASCACVASYLLRDADVETTTRAELRRKHSDAPPVPDFVDLVEHVHDIEPHRGRLGHAWEQIFVGYSHIHLSVRRHVIGICKTDTPPAAAAHRSTEAPAVPE